MKNRRDKVQDKIKLCIITLLILIIAFGVVFTVNVYSNDVNSISENQHIIHQIANYARVSNFKNQEEIIQKLSEVWSLLEEEKNTNIIENIKHRYSDIASNISQSEKDTIARLVWLEARGESNEGQRAVIEVILNRVLNNRFPNTINGVVYQNNPLQFSPSRLIPSTSATSKEYDNLEYVLGGESFVTDESVVFFSTGIQSGRQLYKKIGNHYFQHL